MPSRLLTTSLDWFSKMCLFTWAWLAPASTALIGITILVFIDTLLGIKASMVRGIPFSSRRLSDIISKIITYSLGILATHVLQTLFITDMFNIFKFTVFVFASIELLSIYENMGIIFKIDFVKLVKNMLTRDVNSAKKLFTEIKEEKEKNEM